jgi:hypothetical protein
MHMGIWHTMVNNYLTHLHPSVTKCKWCERIFSRHYVSSLQRDRH